MCRPAGTLRHCLHNLVSGSEISLSAAGPQSLVRVTSGLFS